MEVSCHFCIHNPVQAMARKVEDTSDSETTSRGRKPAASETPSAPPAEATEAAVSPFDAQESKEKQKEKKKKDEKDKKKKEKKDRKTVSSPSRGRSRERRRRKPSAESRKDKSDDKDKKKTKKAKPAEEEFVVVADHTAKPAEPVGGPRKDHWTQGEGGKGTRKGKQKLKCKYCGTYIAGHQSAVDQHQWLNLWCLQHQLWQKMSQHAKDQPESWAKAKLAAKALKDSRQQQHAKDGVDVEALDPESERGGSPAPTLKSQLSAGSNKIPASGSQPVEVRRSVSPSPVKKQEKKKKQKKSSSTSSSGGKKSKRSRGITINIGR